jgi:hypothetical protein
VGLRGVRFFFPSAQQNILNIFLKTIIIELQYCHQNLNALNLQQKIRERKKKKTSQRNDKSRSPSLDAAKK